MRLSEKYFIPFYLREKFQLIGTVTFIAFFSLFFLILSIPFSHNVWFALGNSTFFLFTLLFAVSSLLIVVFSRVAMYRTRHLFRMTYFCYAGWLISEIVLICILYTIFTVEIAKPEMGPLMVFFGSLGYGFVSLAIPDIIAAMFFTIINQDKTIRIMNMKEVVSDEVVKPGEETRITLFDTSGVLKLSVSLNNLYFIESDDNYIQVRYIDSSGSLARYMVRSRLKTVEESFIDTGLVRCHRKFIVNIAKVKVLRRRRDGYELDLGVAGFDPIPVSKTYNERILACFSDLTPAPASQAAGALDDKLVLESAPGGKEVKD